MALACSSSSSSPAPQVKFDVFLSFRGEDTRYGFTSYLYDNLHRSGIKTFMDEQLVRGDEITSSLLKTIKESKISVIIFSENYADSRWCLRELEEICECRRRCGQLVIPVFYKVDPSDLRKQTGSFKSIEKLQERYKESPDRVKRWKDALKEAANLSGYIIKNEKPEYEHINEIVGHILEKLPHLSTSKINEDLIGVKSAIERIESLLRIGSEGVFAVGILGIGGIGKTTISIAVFEKIRSQFEGFYFARNVSEKYRSNKLDELQKELLSTVLKHKNSNIELLSHVIERLKRIKVLIVFDDVTDYLLQVEKLIGSFDNLGSGSRIIITSREEIVLKRCGVKDPDIYEVQGLCGNDALQLFSKYAFRKDLTPEDYKELSNKVVNYTKGVPLALKVLGSYLYDKKKVAWEKEMKTWKKGPHKHIQEVLKTSYDGLGDKEKCVFLDIACFFNGWKRDLVQDILDDVDSYTQIIIDNLHDRSLISLHDDSKLSFVNAFSQLWVDDETISMHDLLQDMGKEISKCNRLWDHEDICKVLRKNKENEEVQGIFLDLSTIGDKRLNLHALAKMPNLRLFRVYNSEVHDDRLHGFDDLESFSTELTYFSWVRYPMKSLPSNFCAENLVRLVMIRSNVKQLWNDVQDLENLRYIDLSYSEQLTDMPDLSKAVNLQKLLLRGCHSLTNIPGVVHSNYIGLYECSKLDVAPNISWKAEELNLSFTPIKEFHYIEHEHYQSKLVTLDLSFCGKLENLSNSIYRCESLQNLFLIGCSKLQLPDDFGDLGALQTSSSNLRSLKHLQLTDCELWELPKNLGLFSSVQVLSLSGNSFESIPETIKGLSNLHVLITNCCKMLRSLPELPWGVNVEAINCSSLESISDSSFLFSHTSRPLRVNFSDCFKLNLSEILVKESPRRLCDGLCYPGNEIPRWFKFQNRGYTLILKDPPDWSNENFIGFNMGVAVAFSELESGGIDVRRNYDVSCYCHIKSNDGEIKVYQYALRGWLNNTESQHYQLGRNDYLLFRIWSRHLILGFANRMDLPVNKSDPRYRKCEFELRNNEALIEFDAEGFEVKECGVHFLYTQDCEELTELINYDEQSGRRRVKRRSFGTFSNDDKIRFYFG